MAKKPLEIDMIAGSQLKDTQGEMLSVEGADISDLIAGKGRLNDNHGKGFFNAIGRVTDAKKILKEQDCTDPRHKYYWEKVKAPFIYVKGYLYDDEDHPNARAAAAILRNIHKSDIPLKIKASVEGGIVSRGIADPSLLAQTKIHSVALTFTPANNATLVEPINLDKSMYNEAADYLLIKSVQHLAETNVPSFRAVQKAASAAKVAKNIRMIQKLLKKAKEEQQLEKGIKEAALGAVALGAAALAPSPISAQQTMQPAAQQVALSPVDVVNSLKGKRPILYSLAVQESSGGRNLNHETLTSGQHKGMTAGGPWGMMPKTAAYVMSLNEKLGKKYPKMAEAIKDLGANHKQITKMLNENPVMAQEFADSLLSHLKKIHGEKSLNKIIHSWHYGIRGTNKAVANGENLDDNEYVRLIRGHIKRLSPQKEKKMSKALTAGYGGAAVPTSRIGGSVMMTEELDAGRGFKYITCDQCGDEQIYAKNQVKCRACNSSFPFSKIAKLIVKLS
jgi:hypothetical protein